VFTAMVRLKLNNQIVVEQPINASVAKAPRVLLIDDNPVAVAMLCDLFDQLTIDYDCVDTIDKALATVSDQLTVDKKPSDADFDVIVVDWTVSFGASRTVSHLFEALHNSANTGNQMAVETTQPRVVVLSGYDRELIERNLERNLERSYQTLAYCVLSKPVKSNVLFNAIMGEQAVPVAINSKVGRLHGLKLLVAEDNMINQMVIAEQLKLEQAEFEIVENGQLCVERLTQCTDFDAVLMDIQMPILSGVEATKQLRAMGWQKGGEYYRQLPIIALTADVYEGAVEVYLDAGFNAYLAKPVKPAQTVNTLLSLVNPNVQ